IARELRNCESVLLSATYDWLRAEQREQTRLAIAYDSPDYAGTLALTPRQPEVACQTITNVRLTPRALEAAVLTDLTIRHAGVREVSFLLPEHLADAHISVPLLRQKIVEPAPDKPQWVRVRLTLQDQVMDHLRVLVEHDRVLTDALHRAAVPIIETGRTDR